MKEEIRSRKKTKAFQTSKKGEKRKKELPIFKKILLDQKKEKESILAAAELCEIEQLQQSTEINNSIEHLRENPVASKFGNNAEMIIKKRECLKRINHALWKFEKGIYGICEECKEEIPIARLKSVSWARFCVDCKTEREADKKRKEKT